MGIFLIKERINNNNMNVQFLKGTEEGYKALENKVSTTFYYTEDNLYLGNIKLSNASDIAEALESISGINTEITNIKTVIGSLESLSTVEKDTLVGAINEVLAKAKAIETSSKITIETDTENSEFAKVYTVKQGETTIGTIDIPKDMFVTDGIVETDPDEDHPGTYIILTLANEDGTKLYINAETLVNTYSAQKNASQIQLSIINNEISATIVGGSITDTELAKNAIITEKIADGNVTLIKLSEEVKASLEKADTAIQKIETGITNGTIKVDNEEVAVAGLGTAAYKSADEFDEFGAAEQALKDAKTYINDLLTWNSF